MIFIKDGTENVLVLSDAELTRLNFMAGHFLATIGAYAGQSKETATMAAQIRKEIRAMLAYPDAFIKGSDPNDECDQCD